MWSLVVPVKRLPYAKTRLTGALPGVPHDDLVTALLLDTLEAALGSTQVARVVAVTDDPDAAAAVRTLGALVVPDQPDAGLNPAVEHGAAAARAVAGDDGVAALFGDLAALRSDDLSTVLAAVGAARSFVRDAAGTGTSLLAAPPRLALHPLFGAGSAARHAASGAVELAAPASVRQDVDTPADLAAAQAIGLGPRSTALLS